MRAEGKKRRWVAGEHRCPAIDRHTAGLSAGIAATGAKIAWLIDRSPTLRGDAQRLQSAPGIGPVAASVLLASMPELGRLSPKRVASLAGIAPVNQDSGAFRGTRRIRGGRRRVRQALYMAALAAIRHCARFAAFYDRTRQRAKARKIAVIAVARKLPIGRAHG